MKLSKAFASGLLLSFSFSFPSAYSLLLLATIFPGLYLAGPTRHPFSYHQLIFLCLIGSVSVLGVIRFGTPGLLNFGFVTFLFLPVNTFSSFNKFFAFFSKSSSRLFCLFLWFTVWPLLNIPLSPTRYWLSSISSLGLFFDFEDKSYNPLSSVISVGDRLFNIEYFYLLIYFLALSTLLFFFGKKIASFIVYLISLTLSSLTLSVGVIGFTFVYYWIVFAASCNFSLDLGLKKYIRFKYLLTIALLVSTAMFFLLSSQTLRELFMTSFAYLSSKIAVETGLNPDSNSFAVVNNIQGSTAAVTRISQLQLLDYVNLLPIGTGAPLPSELGRGAYNLEFSLLNILHKYGILLGSFLIYTCYILLPFKIYFAYRLILTKKNSCFLRKDLPVLLTVALFGTVYLCLAIYSFSNPVFGSAQFIISGLTVVGMSKQLRNIL